MELHWKRIVNAIISFDLIASLFITCFALFLWYRNLHWGLNFLIAPIVSGIIIIIIAFFSYIWTYTKSEKEFLVGFYEMHIVGSYGLVVLLIEFFSLFGWKFLISRDTIISDYGSTIMMTIFTLLHFSIFFWIFSRTYQKSILLIAFHDIKENQEEKSIKIPWKQEKSLIGPIILFINIILLLIIIINALMFEFSSNNFILWPVEFILFPTETNNYKVAWTGIWYIHLVVQFLSIIYILFLKHTQISNISQEKLVSLIKEESRLPVDVIISYFQEIRINSKEEEKNLKNQRNQLKEMERKE